MGIYIQFSSRPIEHFFFCDSKLNNFLKSEEAIYVLLNRNKKYHSLKILSVVNFFLLMNPFILLGIIILL